MEPTGGNARGNKQEEKVDGNKDSGEVDTVSNSYDISCTVTSQKAIEKSVFIYHIHTSNASNMQEAIRRTQRHMRH